MRTWLIIFGLLTACSSPDEPDAVPQLDLGRDAATGPKADGYDGMDAATDVGEDPSDTGEAETPGLVETMAGPIQGYQDGEVWAFKGIPYATAERFARPVSATWDDTLDATQYGAVCPQLGTTPDAPSWGPQPPACDTCTDDECRDYCWSEDCLNLNVWTSALEGDKPVMIWIHGGSYIYGAGSLYDGAQLARLGDVVVVTINYRLGPLGIFAHPDLEPSLNFAMLDEFAALSWVRQNAASFGGDPGNVTIFGESAGGASVCSLMTSDGSAGLFDKGIMQSGTCPWTPRQRAVQDDTCVAFDGCPDLATIEANNLYNCVSADCLGLRIADQLGCDDVDCVREADALEVMRALPQNIGLRGGVLWERFIDGETLEQGPGEALFTGAFQHRPFIMGTTRDEASLFFSPVGPDVTTQQGLTDYIGLWGACSDEIRAFYPTTTDADAREQYLRLLSDYFYTCPTSWNAQSAAYFSDNVWLYEFTHVPWAGTVDIDGTGFRLGAYHSAELPYVFGNTVRPDTNPDCTPDADGNYFCCTDDGLLCFDQADEAFSDEIVEVWSSFARTGAPPLWPEYTLAMREHLALEPGLPSSANLRAQTCQMWLDVISHFDQGSGVCD